MKTFFEYSFSQNLKRVPVGLSGVGLGIAGLGAAYATLGYGQVKSLTSILAAFIIILFIFRKALHFDVLKEELSHHTLGSFIPTFAMALMIVASSIRVYHNALGRGLWLLAILIHIVYFSIFLYHRICNFNLNHMVPSWFVPPIGIVVASTTATNMGHNQLAQGIFYFGFVWYLVLFPIMIYRLTFADRLEDARIPIFGIMGAPASLCLAGYLTAFTVLNPIIIGLLLTLAVLNTLLVYMSLIRVSKVKFNPAFASLTFPLAIGSTAMIKVSNYYGHNTDYGSILFKIGKFEIAIATLVISIVTYKMINFIRNTKI